MKLFTDICRDETFLFMDVSGFELSLKLSDEDTVASGAVQLEAALMNCQSTPG